MIIERIEVNNVGPFLGQWQVTLGEGVTAFIGEYDEAGGRSNRAGKSYLAVDAPMYALYGYQRGDRVEEIPHRLALGKEDAYVELAGVTSAGHQYRITRGRSAGGNPIRTLNGSSISDDELERVVRTEIVGLNLEEYRLTYGAVQGELHKFMLMTAGEKRKVISPWFRTDRWVPRADLARRRLLRTQARLRGIEGELERATEQLASLPALTADLRGAEAELERARTEWKALSVDLEVHRQRLRERQQVIQGVEQLKRKITTLNDKIVNRERILRGTLHSIREQIVLKDGELVEARQRLRVLAGMDALETEVSETQDRYNELLDRVRAFTADIADQEKFRTELLNKYKELVELRTGICPLLREACERIAPDPTILETIKGEGLGTKRAIARLQGEQRVVVARADEMRGALVTLRTDLRRMVELRREATVEQVQRDLRGLEDKWGELETELNAIEAETTEDHHLIAAYEAQLRDMRVIPGGSDTERTELEDLAGAADHRVREWEGRVDGLRALVHGATAAKDQVLALEAEREQLGLALENLTWATYAFGSTGIPSREMENAFGTAEAAMNRALTSMRTPLRVAFSPLRELKDWEATCLICGIAFEKGERTHRCVGCGSPRQRKRRDELRMEVQDGGEVSSFNLDSGGGKTLLSLGVRLGLADLPGRSRAVRCESMIIDEPDGALDEPNRAALHGLLLNGMRDLGIRQVLLITHADVRREFANIVTVHRWEAEGRSGAWNE